MLWNRQFKTLFKRPRNAKAGMTRILQFTLNGRARTDAVRDNLLLLDYLREVVGLTGTKTGCDGGECGACTVLVDDTPRLSCLTLAASVEGRRGRRVLPRERVRARVEPAHGIGCRLAYPDVAIAILGDPVYWLIDERACDTEHRREAAIGRQWPPRERIGRGV